ncbi:MAG: 16S rRNA (uracil(1498)-N(3))-methyltransferase [Verrucomicrobiota bacterium]
MHRFHLAAESWDSATLDEPESHHCLNVLRLDEGDRVTVFDGRGREAQAVLGAKQGARATLLLSQVSKTPPPPSAITLAQAVPKGKNMDLIVQKAVELGAARVVPLLSDRTIVQLDADDIARKREKWQAVALEACKQCGQNHLPEIAAPVSPRDFLERIERNQLLLIASLQPGARRLKDVLADFSKTAGMPPAAVTVLVGPEGDFTPAEIALAKSHGCQPITLGPIILRTETAALYCLSVLAHELFIPEKASA